MGTYDTGDTGLFEKMWTMWLLSKRSFPLSPTPCFCYGWVMWFQTAMSSEQRRGKHGLLGGSTGLGTSWKAPRSRILGLKLLRHLWIFLMEFCLSVPGAQHTVIVITGKQQRVTHLVLEAGKAFTLEVTFKWQRAHGESEGEGGCQRRVDGKITQDFETGKARFTPGVQTVVKKHGDQSQQKPSRLNALPCLN